MADLAEYRIRLMDSHERRPTDGRQIFRPIGWDIVKYPGFSEALEPIDHEQNVTKRDAYFGKQITGYNMSTEPSSLKVTGGNVTLPIA